MVFLSHFLIVKKFPSKLLFFFVQIIFSVIGGKLPFICDKVSSQCKLLDLYTFSNRLNTFYFFMKISDLQYNKVELVFVICLLGSETIVEFGSTLLHMT